MPTEVERANNQQEILEYIRSQKDRLRNDYHVRRIALIGSFARNDQTPNSDVDLLVDIEEGTPNLFELKRSLKREFEQHFNRSVEIASERYLKPYFRDRILKDAIYV